eukprot:CAMPEP_0204113732 /NCGR_PEP_ID=MMETSP0361-20130328/3825_1 /ASSEMBLY_ACC=CAM_ASM_000343 /TAXON_ID=268821 /ORGANISM="Scrippsiella Hangoei, Strain SHTV-5" /LENGTH=57 /DNA_ID=CAMNT_0051064135 /DNA_START=324 /DNA_END=494 /DNA_ORIENTATION=+
MPAAARKGFRRAPVGAGKLGKNPGLCSEGSLEAPPPPSSTRLPSFAAAALAAALLSG